jgi:hypothetical protein
VSAGGRVPGTGCNHEGEAGFSEAIPTAMMLQSLIVSESRSTLIDPTLAFSTNLR